MNKQEFNVASNSINDIEAWLSNLSYNPFVLNWISYASIEAFWQSLKFEEWTEDWNQCIKLSWSESKKFWNKAKQKDTFIYNWIEYIVWSKSHQDLMKDALREQLKQNPNKLKLLLSTWNINLIHKPKKEDWSYYPDSTTIPWEIFSLFLMELRKEFSKINTFSKSELQERVEFLAKSHISTETIEWVNFSFEELAKKMWDLFYEPLASMLNSISFELEKQIDSNEEVVRLIKEACNHILKAWDHCKPYITDINELEKKSKHTFEINDTILTNEQISRAIAYLENDKLKEFLWKLSEKLYRDSEADKWRWRVKLSNELLEASNKLKEASNVTLI